MRPITAASSAAMRAIGGLSIGLIGPIGLAHRAVHRYADGSYESHGQCGS